MGNLESPVHWTSMTCQRQTYGRGGNIGTTCKIQAHEPPKTMVCFRDENVVVRRNLYEKLSNC